MMMKNPNDRGKDRGSQARLARDIQAERAEMQKIKEILAELEREAAKQAMAATKPPLPPGYSRPPVPFRPDVEVEGTKFPEHAHVWEIVEVENHPVGVFCKICDHTMGLADGPLTPPIKAPEPRNYLSLNSGAPYLIEGPGKQLIEAEVLDVNTHQQYQGHQYIEIRFRARPSF